jgi:hypothetical protein
MKETDVSDDKAPEMSVADWSNMVGEIINGIRTYHPENLTLEETAQYYEALTGLIRTNAAMQRELRSDNTPPDPINERDEKE